MKYLWLALLAVVVSIAVFLISRWTGRSSRRLPPNLPPDEFMARMAGEAVSAAQDEFKVDLDYSIDSIQKVEKILGQLHDHYASRSDQRGLNGYAVAYGAYIGETLKRHLHKGHWERNHAVAGENSWPFYLEEGDHCVFPYGWCGKRMQNGEEDNVWVKVQLTLSPPNYRGTTETE